MFQYYEKYWVFKIQLMYERLIKVNFIHYSTGAPRGKGNTAISFQMDGTTTSRGGATKVNWDNGIFRHLIDQPMPNGTQTERDREKRKKKK